MRKQAQYLDQVNGRAACKFGHAKPGCGPMMLAGQESFPAREPLLCLTTYLVWVRILEVWRAGDHPFAIMAISKKAAGQP